MTGIYQVMMTPRGKLLPAAVFDSYDYPGANFAMEAGSWAAGSGWLVASGGITNPEIPKLASQVNAGAGQAFSCFIQNSNNQLQYNIGNVPADPSASAFYTMRIRDDFSNSFFPYQRSAANLIDVVPPSVVWGWPKGTLTQFTSGRRYEVLFFKASPLITITTGSVGGGYTGFRRGVAGSISPDPLINGCLIDEISTNPASAAFVVSLRVPLSFSIDTFRHVIFNSVISSVAGIGTHLSFQNDTCDIYSPGGYYLLEYIFGETTGLTSGSTIQFA